MNKAVPRVLAVGGPDSPELSNGSGGPPPLVHVGRLFGYRVCAYPVGDLQEFRRTMQFLGKFAHLPQFEGHPLLVHISVEGGEDGMAIGPDRTPWEQLTRMISDLCRDLEPCSGPVILALSARGADERELERLLRNHRDPAAHLPEHVFLFVHRVPWWVDTMLAWTHFYGKATEIDFTADSAAERHKVRRLQVHLLQLGFGKFQYFGWSTPGSGCRSLS